MSDSPTSESEFDFICDCEKWDRSACAGEPFYKEVEGKRYCVLHFRGGGKSADFKVALERKLENRDFDFRGVWFPDEVSFRKLDFSAVADFSRATFSAAADFSHATFSAEANFFSATFSAKVLFSYATFSAEANFFSATFSAKVYFNSATFSAQASFSYATFSAEANFRKATFRDYLRFAGTESSEIFSNDSLLDLQFARIEKADRVWFHTLTLHPHWFVNVDPRKFDFINVHWNNSGNAERELGLLKSKDFVSPHRLLCITCRRLAANSEQSDRYREASQFRRMAMDAERLETWHGFDARRLNWWYWVASGYGERPFQALLVLIGILVLFGLLYTQVGFARSEPRAPTEASTELAKPDDIGAPLKYSRALTYSAAVMTLQKPEPKPATTTAQALVLLETILGPVQAALLALAIRRKFMR
jgi:hypothetical protein